jgi:predicted transcriptional regulator
MTDDRASALARLGPLEGRIMAAVWDGRLSEVFVVREVHGLIPELAYTTIMTTLHRLAAKGLLRSTRLAGVTAHQYRAAASPSQYLATSARRELDGLVERYGDRALTALALRIGDLTPEEIERLRRLAEQ